MKRKHNSPKLISDSNLNQFLIYKGKMTLFFFAQNTWLFDG